jgi:hypothetical protein
MIPLNILFSTYLRQIKIVLASIIVLGVAITIFSFRYQRNKARAQVIVLQQTIDGYKLAMAQAKVQLDAAVVQAAAEGIATAEQIRSLQANLPQSDEAARKWAIEAGKVIR